MMHEVSGSFENFHWLLLIQMRSAPLKMPSLSLTWSTDLVSKNKRHYKDDKAIFKGKVLFEDQGW